MQGKGVKPSLKISKAKSGHVRFNSAQFLIMNPKVTRKDQSLEE